MEIVHKRRPRRDEYEIHRQVWEVMARSPDQKRDFLFRHDDGEVIVRSKSDRCQATEGGTYRFHLRAVAVITINQTGKRISVAMKARQDGQDIQDALRGWLEKRAAPNGFELLEVAILDERMRAFRKPGHGKIYLPTCDYEGILRVRNRCLMERAIREGIGHGRAFGCGLLLLEEP